VLTERKGVNKTRATLDDLLGLFTLLGVHQVELPCYVILDIRRVPAMDSKVDVDVSVVTATALVNDLRQQVSALSDKVDICLPVRRRLHPLCRPVWIICNLYQKVFQCQRKMRLCQKVGLHKLHP
jgi:hypothetical protein